MDIRSPPVPTSTPSRARVRYSRKCSRPGIPTQPSHTTIFTGQHPVTHGVVAHGGKAKLGRGTPFLPEMLLGEGYTTCAVDTLFRERIWFGRGWEYIIDPSLHHLFYASVTQEELNDRAIHWMKTVPKGPFFMFIHYWDVHYPYMPPDRMRGMFYKGGNPTDPNNHELDEWWDHPVGAMARDTWLRTPNGLITDPNYVTALYDREIRYLDEGIAALSDALDKLGLAENTMVVLLADHGESMTDHRIFYDHYGLHDCVVQVPTIIRWPGGKLKAGTRFALPRQLFDISPTLLEAAGSESARRSGRQEFPGAVDRAGGALRLRQGDRLRIDLAVEVLSAHEQIQVHFGPLSRPVRKSGPGVVRPGGRSRRRTQYRRGASAIDGRD